MWSVARLLCGAGGSRTKGEREELSSSVVEVMQVLREVDTSINEDVRGLSAETAEQTCDIQQHTQRPKSSRVLCIKGMEEIETRHHERI